MKKMVISGLVKRGRQQGRKDNFPTINLSVPDFVKKSDWGVYASIIQVDDKFYPAVTHLGPASTFAIKKPSCESYILTLSKKLYRKKVVVILVEKFRPTKKFVSREQLRKQITQDVKKAKKFFNL